MGLPGRFQWTQVRESLLRRILMADRGKLASILADKSTAAHQRSRLWELVHTKFCQLCELVGEEVKPDREILREKWNYINSYIIKKKDSNFNISDQKNHKNEIQSQAAEFHNDRLYRIDLSLEENNDIDSRDCSMKRESEEWLEAQDIKTEDEMDESAIPDDVIIKRRQVDCGLLDMLESDNQFCDVTLVSQEGGKLRSHRAVLSACSPFLRQGS